MTDAMPVQPGTLDPPAEPCRFGARRKDAPAQALAPLRAARSAADAGNQPVTRSRFKIWYLGAFGSFSAMPPLCLPGGRPGPSSAMGTGLRRCDRVFDVSIAPPSPIESSEWV